MVAKKSQFAATLVGVVLVAIMVVCAWLSPFDTNANEQVDAGLKRAVATYATARILTGLSLLSKEPKSRRHLRVLA